MKSVPIKSLIKNQSTKSNNVERYVIPDYQRGYRWTDIHVNALLKDIHSFKEEIYSIGSKEKYCLQPIVICPSISQNGDKCWEVIDGQQRLITLYLIINYLKRLSYQIDFDKREKSTSFIKQLVDTGVENHGNPDFHFMSCAYRCIKEWFDKFEDDITYKDDFASILLSQVEVLWYEVNLSSSDDKIDIFNRLNIGKIPLTDSELIKALLLTKIQGNLNPRELVLRQSEISNEWQQMEVELRKPEVWLFLNCDKEKYASHIELLFDLIAGAKNKANYSTYLYFENRITGEDANDIANVTEEAKRAYDVWNEIKLVYGTIMSWFCYSQVTEKPTLYHYVGYLLVSGKKEVKDVLEVALKKDKIAFKNWLKAEMLDSISKINLLEVNYESVDNDQLRNVFLLLNVLACEQNAIGLNNRFPFDRYVEVKQERGNGWSIEHIHAQRSRDEMKNVNAIKTWVEETLDALRGVNHIVKKKINNGVEEEEDIDVQEYKEKLNSIKISIQENKLDIDYFNKIKDGIIKLFDSTSVHEFSNLALLSRKVNSSLNNAIFPVKRNAIIKMDKEGKFIPPCTRNVFLKYYSESNNQPYYWSELDKKHYFNEMQLLLNSIK